MNRIAAVTGIGCVTVAGVGAGQTWEALLRGQVLGQLHPAEGQMPQHWTARAPESAALEGLLFGLSYPRPSRTTILSMTAAQECWQNAGADGQIDHDRAGCAMSRNFGQHEVVGRYLRVLWEKGPASVSGLQFVQTISNTVLGKVSLDFHLRGPSILNLGAPVLGLALDTLRDDDADVMLVGGIDELSLYTLTRVCLGGIAALSDETFGPYDARRHGLLPGEGAAFLLLEKPEFAKARGAKVLGYLCGYASVADRSKNSFNRNEDDIGESIRRALEDSDVAAEDIALVCGAGTRLPNFDCAELQALEKVFPTPPVLFSCKGALGETWGASAYLSAISVLKAFSTGLAPPTAGTTELESGCRVPIIVERPAPVCQDIALVLSLDMSGQNSAYVFVSKP